MPTKERIRIKCGTTDFAFIVLVVTLTVSSVLVPNLAQTQVQRSIKVGAWGDDASRGNMGVQVSIRTHTYDAYPGVLDYFWVGNNLEDGSFIQFGYSLQPGFFCLKGSVLQGKFTCQGSFAQVDLDDARWEWQYWPDRHAEDFYYEIGPTRSAGLNATWHTYTMSPNQVGGWAFTLDDAVVSTANFSLAQSTDPIFVVAEKSSASQFYGQLGPVEFRNLAYSNGGGWNKVESLVSIVSCTPSNMCDPNLHYGISSVGSNDIILGSAQSNQVDGQLLWTTEYVTLSVAVDYQTEVAITDISGRHVFEGNASIKTPKAMFVYVSLLDPMAPMNGLLGRLGFVSAFQSWTGDLQSENATLRVLMNRDMRLATRSVASISTSLVIVIIAIAMIAIAFTANRIRVGKAKGAAG